MTIEKKYQLINEFVIYEGRQLYRIQALRSFSDVKEGDIGGYVEKELNLSQSGDCWIYDNARVYDDGMVLNNAKICNYADVSNGCTVSDNAYVGGYSVVRDNTHIKDNAYIHTCPHITNSTVSDDVQIYGHCTVKGSTLTGKVQLYGNAYVANSTICDEARIYGYCNIDNVYIQDNAIIHGNVHISSPMHVGKNADIREQTDIILISKILYLPNQYANLTFYKNNTGGISVSENQTVYALEDFFQLINVDRYEEYGNTEYIIKLKRFYYKIFECVKNILVEEK